MSSPERSTKGAAGCSSGGATCRNSCAAKRSRTRRSASSAAARLRESGMSGRPMAGEDLGHGFDEAGHGHGELRRPRLAPDLAGGDLARGSRAFDQVLDLHDALLALVRALDDDAGAAAAVGVFHLRLHAGPAEIELGPDAGAAGPPPE